MQLCLHSLDSDGFHNELGYRRESTMLALIYAFRSWYDAEFGQAHELESAILMRIGILPPIALPELWMGRICRN